MIPQRMRAYLRERLPERTWKTRLVRQGGKCFMEFDTADIDRLARLRIVSVVSKPAEMGGNRIDQLGAAAGGIIIALHALLEEMPWLPAI